MSWLRLQSTLVLYPGIATRALEDTRQPHEALNLARQWKPDLVLPTLGEMETLLRGLKRSGA
ncbi:MAG: hypothetical protein JRC77_08690, partial [Deltaproteobacteria bacterium]|nr:hypothetical protein [Deltaproteobacteria bacterium]